MARYGKTSNPSVMAHSFSQVPHADIQRSTFSRDHGHKTSMDAGLLYPIFCDEALPGDSFSVRLSSIARMATPIVPIMDNIFIDFHFFAIPNRLLWSNWQKFMGEQDNPGDSTDYLVPTITPPAGGYVVGSIYDFMGIPTGVENITINALHLRAYNLCYAEWYRDQNLLNSPTINLGDGPDNANSYQLLRRGKRHDYFTSCLPWPQKGDDVNLPLGTSAPVNGSITGNGTTPPTFNAASYGPFNLRGDATDVTSVKSSIQSGGVTESYYWGSPELLITGATADLSSATAITVNALREAIQLQKMLERDARGGTRYTEILRSHFRVTSPDARLQRPEYLGGGSSRVNISPIPQTTPSGIVPDVTPQGHLAAIGYHSQSGVGFTKSFVEHSVILGLASIRADLTYQQGLNRMWSRQTKYDFYWPALAHLGEEPVYSREIFADGTAADDDVFGYQERWASYRYKPSLITGQLRSTFAQSLDVWHLSQEFSTRPVLNQTFIGENPPLDRVVAVTDQPKFIFDGFFRVKTTRPMPMYSVPGLVDHF